MAELTVVKFRYYGTWVKSQSRDDALHIYLSEGGVNIEGEDDSYDFGSGAGFYVNATEEKWKTNYRMYSYIIKEVSTCTKHHSHHLNIILERLAWNWKF